MVSTAVGNPAGQGESFEVFGSAQLADARGRTRAHLEIRTVAGPIRGIDEVGLAAKVEGPRLDVDQVQAGPMAGKRAKDIVGPADRLAVENQAREVGANRGQGTDISI